MTDLLVLREKIKALYGKNEVFILPVVKFLLAFLILNVLNAQMGYMTRLDNMAIVLVVALACSFLPMGSITLFAALFSLLHLYALSLEAALIGFCMYLVLFLLFLRMSSKYILVVALTPLLFVLKVPYVMPVAAGLLGTPAVAVFVGCGVAVYYLLATVVASAPTISTMGDEDIVARLRLLIDGLIGNKAMAVMVAAFVITVIAVYLIRRMSVDHSWTIAIIAGVILDLVILLVGDLVYDTNLAIGNAILGAVVAAAAAKVIEFFRFCVDYSRTEKVQFEDDEYYYYVKAVPKMTVAAPTKTVKRINTQRRPGNSSGGARSVTTERMGTGRPGRQRTDYRGGRTGGRSMTITSDAAPENNTDDYEEI